MKTKITFASLTLASLISAAVIPSTAAAEANIEPFLGVGTGIQFDHVDHDNELGGAVQLRGGATLYDNHRLMLSYQYSDSVEQSTYLASYDYLYPVASKVSLFAGVSAGVSDSDFDTHSNSESVWGGQTGVIFEFDSVTSLELSYRYLDQDNEVGGILLDSTQQFSASIDFKF